MAVLIMLWPLVIVFAVFIFATSILFYIKNISKAQESMAKSQAKIVEILKEKFNSDADF